MFNHTRLAVAASTILILCVGCGGGGGDGEAGATHGISASLLDSCPVLHPAQSPARSLGGIVDAQVVAEMQSRGLPSMTVEIAKNGSVLYAQGYGYASLAPACIPARPDTEYQIGSVTKQFTAAAILQLESAGVVSLDSAVIVYLPNLSIDPRISLRMLLNQTSGLADYLGFPLPDGYTLSSPLPQQQLLAEIAHAPLIFAPGSAYSYSNSNYFILGAIVEAVTARTYAEYLDAHIFQPAGLIHTYTAQPQNSALPYTYDNPAAAGTTGLAAGIVTDPSFAFSAGAVWSNVQDLALWDAALRDGQIIAAGQFAAMVAAPASVPVYQQAGTASPYAMGWVAATKMGHPAVWHNGETLAYTAFNEIFLDDGFSVSILTNVDIEQAEEATPLLPFADSLIQAICTSPETAANC